MSDIHNGMPADRLGADGWEKPWSGPNGGSCVELKRLGDGRVAVRQSTDPAGPALICSDDAMASFVEGAKNGLADFLLEAPPGPGGAAPRAGGPAARDPRGGGGAAHLPTPETDGPR